ncbi:secreted protein/lipoprotein [Streptomyces parvus]|uniref:secreted protein/lipoprotein n=1 Tax=Streptomyces parvus TaxID=66428 RepID=UPI0034350E3C
MTLAALTGCSSDKPADEKAAPSTPAATKPAPAPSTTEAVSEEEAMQAEAISVYQAHWEQKQALYADADADTDTLKQFAAAEALVGAKNDVQRMRDANQVITGKVTMGDQTVTKSDLNRKVPKVFLSTCLDITQWNVLDAKTRKPVSLPSTRLTKYTVDSLVEKWPQGWRVVRDRPMGKKC